MLVFHVRLGRFGGRVAGVALLSLAALVLLSHFKAPWGHLSRRIARPAPATLRTCSQSDDLAMPSPSELSATLESLLTVPANEVGRIAICASLRNEGRFINEWLLYYRVLGVDRFYLYDSGSDDDTLSALQPWLRTGTVQLHRFRNNQEGHYQTTALDTCSRTYGPKTEWLVEADCDEFLVVVPTLLSTDHSRPLELSDMPNRPLYILLDSNWLYKNADAVVVSRLTWKNAGFERLPDGVSLLSLQTVREYQHSVLFDKLLFTKSILHTGKKRTGWSIPGAHFLRSPHATAARIVTSNGHLVDTVPYRADTDEGLQYEGRFSGGRIFEPLVLYHYVERDLQDCYSKLRVAHKLRKGGYDVYEDPDSHTPIYDQDGFYGAATTDRTMADSWFGRFLPPLLAALRARERDDVEARRGPLLPQIIEPHPELVAEWVAEGLDPTNGMPLTVTKDA
ncbi:hypothetical protein BMF94_1395 [Rhodotorula taiwanensis]|uniref:Glycosyltransferase family 2 protein n=1 Tax=Rhodotorula taiwanensis TaxID=741276 RepID=A0A2S5BFH1_9BASI|nr:hypothetical protein BMF94_1395 [Rhodotorula taiwanensis]